MKKKITVVCLVLILVCLSITFFACNKNKNDYKNDYKVSLAVALDTFVSDYSDFTVAVYGREQGWGEGMKTYVYGARERNGSDDSILLLIFDNKKAASDFYEAYKAEVDVYSDIVIEDNFVCCVYSESNKISFQSIKTALKSSVSLSGQKKVFYDRMRKLIDKGYQEVYCTKTDFEFDLYIQSCYLLGFGSGNGEGSGIYTFGSNQQAQDAFETMSRNGSDFDVNSSYVMGKEMYVNLDNKAKEIFGIGSQSSGSTTQSGSSGSGNGSSGGGAFDWATYFK